MNLFLQKMGDKGLVGIDIWTFLCKKIGYLNKFYWKIFFLKNPDLMYSDHFFWTFQVQGTKAILKAVNQAFS